MRAYLFYFVLVTITLGCQQKINKALVTNTDHNTKVLIRNVDIFNGRDSILLLQKDVLIENATIQKISDQIIVDTNLVTIIDGTGKTLMPGMIDAHVHLSGSGCVPWEMVPADMNYNLSAYLYAGITTVYDLGGLSKTIETLADQVDDQKIMGSTIYHTHIPITIKNSHPIPLTEQMLPFPLKALVNQISPTIGAPKEAEKLIKAYTKHDIDYVKIICDQIPSGTPEMNFNQLKALIDETHKRHFKAFVHIGSPQNAIDAINAGADVLAHGVWRGKLSEAQAKVIGESKIPIIYTLAGFHNVKHIYNGQFVPSELDQHLVPKSILEPVTRAKGEDAKQEDVIGEFFEDVDRNSSYWLENFELLRKYDAVILVGSDSNLPGTYAGSTYLQELMLLKTYGMSNYEILHAATDLNAQLFLNTPTFGTVKIGQEANLLLLNGNPLKDIEVIKTPYFIMHKGRIIKRI